MLTEFLTTGRLGRCGFWLRHLLLVPAGLFLCIAVATLLGRPLDLLPAIVLVLALISTWGRRLHDRGRSAWWLLALLVPVLGPLLLFVECGFRRSAVAAARFGPDPDPRPDYAVVPAVPVP